jgi:hypothetical protein
MFLHLFIYEKFGMNDCDHNVDHREVIKEYHFYISDDPTHDTFFLQHCFDSLYKELMR